MSKALEAAARELVKYNTIPELYEQEWPKCANPARAAILAFLREADTSELGAAVRDADNPTHAAIARALIKALTRLAEGPAP